MTYSEVMQGAGALGRRGSAPAVAERIERICKILFKNVNRVA